MKFITDPKSNIPSVSLTILMISVLVVLVAFGLNIAGVVENTSIALEFFGISASLYFGRNLQLGSGKIVGASAPADETKVETK